jgi:hypothetical protein
MKQAFIPKRFGADAVTLIGQMESICNNYHRQGYDLSLRQPYYQLVSRNIVANTEQSYKRVGGILSDARLAGKIDWNMIVDRGRETTENNHWDSPAAIIEACSKQFRYELWADQPWHVEVMVEKQALEGVLEPVCKRLDIPFTANKGYSSSSAMYEAGRRLETKLSDDKNICVLYLGDHDPSGIDMTRDVQERLMMFSGFKVFDEDDKDFYEADRFEDREFVVKRLALNMPQIRQYNPPPNPAKLTDSRATSYIRKHGNTSWELDALEPSVLAALVTEAVEDLIDDELMEAAKKRQQVARDVIADLAARANQEEADRLNDEDDS